MRTRTRTRTIIGAGVVTLALASPALAWSALKGDPPLDVAPAAAPALRDTTMADAVQETARAADEAQRWENLAVAHLRNVAVLVHEAERQAAVRRPSSGGGSSYAGTAVGECTGFSIPDYIIQRESGGDPNAHNPSGAHGCSQTLLSHYEEKHACQGLDPNTVEGQRECTRILSNDGTNLAPWAATR